MDRISYWKDLATYDIDTAEAMFVTRRWLMDRENESEGQVPLAQYANRQGY